MASMAIDYATIATALRVLRSAGGFVDDWKASGVDNTDQRSFLDVFYRPSADACLSVPEIKSLASASVEELNQFLADHGFDIRLESLVGIGAVALFNLLVEWVEPGKVRQLKARNSQTYPGFILDDATLHLGVQHRQDVIELPTANGDAVWIMPLAEEPRTVTHAFYQALDTMQLRFPTSHGLARRAHLPMVSLDCQPDISWLLGLHCETPDGSASIGQAIQQVRFKMNQFGAEGSAATAMGFESCLVLPDIHTVDGPFLAWMTKGPGHGAATRIPLAVSYVDYDSWKDPGSLGAIQ